MKIRPPCVAGQFYEKEKPKLLLQVSGCLPPEQKPSFVRAVLVPHAGLMYSGKVAGEIYASLDWTPTVVFLGPNHTGEGKPFSLSAAHYWRTPLGDVETDSSFSRHLLEVTPELKEDDTAHQSEHSLEVQLPFLQVLSKKTKIVPISIGLSNPEAYKHFGERLAEAMSAFQKNYLVITSSDMTHYEPDQEARDKDHDAIEAILSLDPDELTRRVRTRQISMCGFAPVLSMLCYARKRGSSRGELLRYETSGDASGDYTSVVGYAGIRIP